MKSLRNIIFVVIAVLSAVSCKNNATIPRNTMSDIYYDIYIADQMLERKYDFKNINDTTNLYVTIIEKYGYTQEDYQKSLDFYMVRPDTFEKVFERTKKKLEKRKVELEKQLAAEEKVIPHWGFLDSLEMFTSDTVQRNNLYYSLRILLFEPDTCVPNSPVFDTLFAERPQNPIDIFPLDTVPYSFKTYLSKPIPNKIIVDESSKKSNYKRNNINKPGIIKKKNINFYMEEEELDDDN